MKTLSKMRFIPLLLTSLLVLVVMLVVPATSMAALQPPVNLGTASSFTLLAGSTITSTGPTTINGDVGVHPGNTFTRGVPPAICLLYTSDAADDLLCVDLGGRRIIKKKKKINILKLLL